jgi:hypothetical protein
MKGGQRSQAKRAVASSLVQSHGKAATARPDEIDFHVYRHRSQLQCVDVYAPDTVLTRDSLFGRAVEGIEVLGNTNGCETD